jgi:hypothetical protein
VFEDEGFSGATLECPGLERVRDLAAEGQIQVVLAYSPDRLSRKYAYQILLMEELAKHGVETLFVNAPQGTSAEDQLLVQFQGMIAEYERAQILASGMSVAFGSPSTIRQKMRSSRARRLNARISSLTHFDWAALGEQITICAADPDSAALMSAPRSVALGSSSRSLKMGDRRLGTGPRSVTVPMSCWAADSVRDLCAANRPTGCLGGYN